MSEKIAKILDINMMTNNKNGKQNSFWSEYYSWDICTYTLSLGSRLAFKSWDTRISL